MLRLLLGAALLSILVSVSLPLDVASVGTVAFQVCNAGKTDVDAFFSQSNQVTGKHIGPADCATIAKTEGRMAPAYVGIAFVDAKGQWGAARRQDLLPEWGSDGILQRSTQTALVKHGAASVSLPMQLLLQPAVPECHQTGGESFSARNNLPLYSTTSQRIDAENWDRAHSTPGELVCQQLVYTLNVDVYPDTKELTFKKFCDSCDKKREASLTPEERATRQRMAATGDAMIRNMESAPGIGGIMKGAFDLGRQELAKEDQARAAELAPAMRVNWSDMTMYVYLAFREDHRMKPVNRHIVVQGTVERVSVSSPNTPYQRFNVYFKEDSNHQLAFCESSEDILREMFGPNYSTVMVGKVVEVEGTIGKPCHDVNAGIQVSVAHQLRVMGPGVAPMVAHVWSPADNPIPVTNPAPVAAPARPAVAAAPASANQAELARVEAARVATVRRDSVPRAPATPSQGATPVAGARTTPSSDPLAAASITPARVPAAPAPAQAAPVRDPLVNNVISLLKAKIPEIRIMLMLRQRNRSLNLTGADRGELENAGASENLIEAMINPASIGPEVTPQAAAAAARQNAAAQRSR